MKKIFFVALSCLLAVVSIAQVQETVTINVNGNRNKQIAVDGRYYTINNVSASGEKDVVISDLANGQHTLQVVRTNPNNNRTTTTNTTFTLREGYDLNITVNGNGAVTTTEKRSGRNTGTAITTAAFNKLYAATQQRTSSASRATFLENEFVNTNKLFTSSQASQLIKLVNSESLRLALAKNAYTRVTDRQNYSVVSNLLISSSSRASLETYIASVPVDDDDDDVADAGTPMSNERFQTIYREVSAEYSATDKNYYLVNFFGKDYNYYTSYQARQLIQLVPTEAERFHLAKLAYRGTTDRENYNQVVQLLSSSYNRSQLSTYMATFDQSNPILAMSSTQFNTLYQSIYRQSSTSSRYTAISNAFTTTGYYFTTAQAKQLIQLVNNESSRLLLSKTAYKVLVDRTNYRVLNDLLTSQANRNDFEDYVYSYENYGSGTGAGMAMTDAEFKTIYNNIAGSWSSSSRYNAVSTAFENSNNYFSTTQARQLLLLISSETERLALAKQGFDNIVDQNNYAAMSDLFANSSNSNEWARYATQFDGGVYVKTPMTDSEFSTLYRSVQFTFGIGAKMSSLTEIFNKETNYFTVAQAKQLIQLVSAESNRLELAKLAYANLTNPENYTELYTVFSSQSSKDEFNAFVGSNAYLNK
jgi:hypothetical protein